MRASILRTATLQPHRHPGDISPFPKTPSRVVHPGPMRHSLQHSVATALVYVGATLACAGCTQNQVWFSQDEDLTEVLTDHMATASDSLDVAVYTFTSEPIRDALIDADARGVRVRVIIDTWATNDPIAASLDQAGVPMRRAEGYGEGGIMHHKFAVVDETSVATGSFNFTVAADSKNDENLLILADKALAGQYTSAFSEIWRRAE